MKTVPVLAGSFREFQIFIHDLVDESAPKHFAILNGSTALIDNVRYFYVSDERSLRGVRFHEFKTYGTWHLRRDGLELRDLMNCIKIRGE